MSILFGPGPFLAWVCSVLGCLEAIEELLNCILRAVEKETAARCGPPPIILLVGLAGQVTSKSRFRVSSG